MGQNKSIRKSTQFFLKRESQRSRRILSLRVSMAIPAECVRQAKDTLAILLAMLWSQVITAGHSLRTSGWHRAGGMKLKSSLEARLQRTLCCA